MVFRYAGSRHPMQQLRREMDRLLSGFADNLGHAAEGAWTLASRGQPAVNVWEDAEAVNVDDPRAIGDGLGMFIVDENECTRCALCVDRCPTGVISLGKFEGSLAQQAEDANLPLWDVDTGQRDFKNGYAYGMRY